MTTVVFVHGTGVRQPHYDTTFKLIAAAVDGPVAPCYWGGECGAALGYGGRSIPDPMEARGTTDSDEVELWALLDIDPYYELRLLAAKAAGTGERTPDAMSAAQSLSDASSVLLADAAVGEAAVAAGLADTIDEAIMAVYAARPTTEAIASPSAQPAELASAIARAITAEAMRLADAVDGGLRPLSGDDRDELADRISLRLHPDDRSISVRRAFSRLGKAALGVAVELGATRAAERRRAAITSATAATAGDVLLYLARGAAIRAFIADVVAAVDDDVVLLAHSLGGIACVDLLIADPPPKAKGLITVGSQAPFLHELGALPGLAPQGTLPGTFPVPWINVYDERDLLSFLAEPVFGERVRDYRVDSRAPFPRSHSAYFRNEAVYAVVRSVVDAVSP